MTISTPNDLINYIEKHFDSLTDEQYIKLLNNTLKVYPMNKPTNVMEAILTINEMSKIPLEIRPLFPDVKTFDNE
jgi:uncharacterized UPF0146 family protein